MNDTLTSFPKIEKDGKVAVLYSPGYGAGWSTWNNEEWRALLTMHRDIVQCVLDNDKNKAAEIAEKLICDITGNKDEYVCVLGAEDLTVRWLDKGTQFEITEYDGSESLEPIYCKKYLTA